MYLETKKINILQVPKTKEEWKAISDGFREKWNYPFCLGALDGKHVAMKQPENSGTEYFNYKHFFSVLLFALVDHNYKFIYIDVGASGRNGDAGLFARSTLKRGMDNKTLGFPDSEVLDGTGLTMNYHIIGDDAFPLRDDLLKPYPHRQLDADQRIFNYRFSRARRVVENAFGILANRFRVFLTKINLEPDKVEKIVLAACCLHNMLIDKKPIDAPSIDQEDCEHNVIPGRWRENPSLATSEKTTHRNCTLSAKGQRTLLKTFFNSAIGSVPWQDKMIAVQILKGI